MAVVPPGRSGEEERRFDGGDKQHEPDHHVLLPVASYLSWTRFSAPNGSEVWAVQTFVEFPQRQKSASFSLDQVIAKLQEGATAASS
jgi:hypothetical protein